MINKKLKARMEVYATCYFEELNNTLYTFGRRKFRGQKFRRMKFRGMKFRRISKSRNFVVGKFVVLTSINSVHEKISFDLFKYSIIEMRS